MRSAKGLILIVSVAVFLSASQWAQGVTVADLLKVGAPDVASGDKVFYSFGGFSSSGAGGASAVPTSSISVEPHCQFGEHGLIFTSNAFTVAAGQTQRTTLDYWVTSVCYPTSTICDNTLALLSALVEGDGSITINEWVRTGYSGEVLATKSVTVAADSQTCDWVDHQAFTQVVPFAYVSMEILLNGGAAGGGGSASLYSFTQTFSQIPEPLTMGCVFLSVLGVGGYVRRRRRA